MHNRRFLLAIPVLWLATAAPAQESQSTFGHARARKLAEMGKLPTTRDIVVRDIVNYHRHRLPMPGADDAIDVEVRSDLGGAAPGEEFWLQVGYAAKGEGDRALAPPCAVALVVDCSGSMGERGKMSQVHRGLQAFVDRLRPDDQIALVAFATEAHVVTPLRRRADGRWLQTAIRSLQPEGNTNLHDGLMAGLDQLACDDVGEVTRRLVLLTDGIANTGVTDARAIAVATRERSQGAIDISTIGVGENLDTALLQRLADKNRGLFHFVADERDVQKIFVREADSLLVPVGRNVSLVLHLGIDVEVLDVIGHPFKSKHKMHYTIALADLNAGATGVVMLRCRMKNRAECDQLARAYLYFVQPGDTHRTRRDAATTLHVREKPPGRSPDLIVRKNAAIATLADGLGAMARSCEARRWADADRVLRRACDEAQRLFPGEDDDVQRVRDIAAGHQKTLRRYVERFRDI